MKLNVSIDDVTRSIELTRDDGMVTGLVDGRDVAFAVSQPEPNVYLVREGGRVEEFYVSDDGSTISHRGLEFRVNVIDPRDGDVGAAGAASLDGIVEIKTAMPGKLVKVLVTPGSAISSGDGVVVVEAMKMQNEMRSPKDGIVKEIRFAEGSTVGAGDVLAVIE